jgi:hypothetical protein
VLTSARQFFPFLSDFHALLHTRLAADVAVAADVSVAAGVSVAEDLCHVAVHVTSHEPRALLAPPPPFEGGVSRSGGGGGEAAKLETVNTCGYVAVSPRSLQHVLPLVDSSIRTHVPPEQVLPLVGGSREGGGGEGESRDGGSGDGERGDGERGSTPASPSVNGETRVNVNAGHVPHTRVTIPAFEPTVSDTASSPATHHTAPSHTTHNTEISYTTNGSLSTRELMPAVDAHAHAHAAWFQKHFANSAATTALQQTAASRQGRVGGGTHFTCFTGTKVQVLTQHK